MFSKIAENCFKSVSVITLGGFTGSPGSFTGSFWVLPDHFIVLPDLVLPERIPGWQAFPHLTHIWKTIKFAVDIRFTDDLFVDFWTPVTHITWHAKTPKTWSFSKLWVSKTPWKGGVSLEQSQNSMFLWSFAKTGEFTKSPWSSWSFDKTPWKHGVFEKIHAFVEFFHGFAF